MNDEQGKIPAENVKKTPNNFAKNDCHVEK